MIRPETAAVLNSSHTGIITIDTRVACVQETRSLTLLAGETCTFNVDITSTVD